MDPSHIGHEITTTKSHRIIEDSTQHAVRQQDISRTADSSTTAALSSTSVSTSPVPSKHSKLDGVLYHFYSKTLAVITNCRLTHYDASSYDTSQQTTLSTAEPSSSSTANRSNTATSSTPYPGRRANKWFELDVADYDFFRDEVRLWRNISTMIPSAVWERPASMEQISEPCCVPPMVLDIILDTSSLDEKSILTMDISMPGPSRRKRRVRVDGKEDGVENNRGGKGKQHSRKPIVLESWRLELGVCNPPDPPDLPTLYRQATAHLKELSSLARQLPAHSMFSRMQKAKSSTRKLKEEASSEVETLKMGVRLGVDKADEGEKDEGICGLREPLSPLLHSSRDDSSIKVTETFTFQPLITAIGVIQCSVEYRVDAEFYIEDVDVVLDMRDLELDEDYFRPNTSPSHAKAFSKAEQTSASSQGGVQESRSLSLQSSDRKQSILASEAVATLSGSGRGATPSPPSELISRSPGPASANLTSVFSNASTTSGRPVAGLANLRRSPSTTAHGSSPTTTMTAVSNSSPVAATVLTSDAAFLTHGRRTSTSERRLRTISTLSSSSDKNSPPAVASSTSPSTQFSSRPILSRTSANVVPSLRSGSYSPSSPSPLAQQMSAQNPVTSQSSFRMSSSPSYRNASLPLSASPNLRSVFQSYTPSHSQTSISSLSRTPPKFITEGSSIANTSSLGLHSNSAAQSSPSQSSLAEGRQPSVAPQMIKRYSSTFNYRQGRQTSSGIAGSSIESEGSNSVPYSKSWQARIEQRQMFTARSLGREEGSHFSTGSGQSGAFFASSYSPRMQRQSIGASTSQEEDLDDFVRMIDSNHPGEASSSSAGHPGTNSVESTQRRGGTASFTSASSGVGFTRQYGWNRNQVDEMLNKMQNSVREFSTSSASRGSGASGGAATASSSGGSGQSGGLDEVSPVNQGLAVIQSASPSFVRSPLSRVGFSATTANSGIQGKNRTDTSATAATNQKSLQVGRQPPPYRYNLPTRRELHTQANIDQQEESNLTSSDVREDAVMEEEELQEESRSRRARRTASRGSIELYANQPHSYDPLEDEAVGRLELVQDDLNSSVPGGEGPRVQSAHHHHHHHHPADTVTSEAAERRRADIELARNFGQVVSSSSNRGNPRASLSPWRNRMPSQNSTRGGNGANGGSGAGASAL